MQATKLRETTHFAAMELGSALIVCWKQSATIAALRDLEAPAQEMVAKHPDGIVWMVITGNNANPEEEEFSKESSLQLQRFKAHVKAIACVQASITLKGRLTTVILHVIGVLSKGVVAVKIFKTTAEACLWLHREMAARQMAGRLTLEDFSRQVQSMSERYVPSFENSPGHPKALTGS